jgi:hypothetical protein
MNQRSILRVSAGTSASVSTEPHEAVAERTICLPNRSKRVRIQADMEEELDVEQVRPPGVVRRTRVHPPALVGVVQVEDHQQLQPRGHGQQGQVLRRREGSSLRRVVARQNSDEGRRGARGPVAPGEYPPVRRQHRAPRPPLPARRDHRCGSYGPRPRVMTLRQPNARPARSVRTWCAGADFWRMPDGARPHPALQYRA